MNDDPYEAGRRRVVRFKYHDAWVNTGQFIARRQKMKSQVLQSLGLLVLMSFFTVTNSLGADKFPVISTEGLKAKMDAGEKLMLINPLCDIEFNMGYIPGSVNIPIHTIMTTDKLPQDKDTLIITYCLGPK